MKDLILIHGALGHSSNFEPYEAFLSKHFRIHKMLLYGHGGSSIPDEGLHVELYVQQIKDYIETHQLQDIHFFGYSLGGYVAMCYAFHHPEKVASILTLAVKLDWNIEAANKETASLNPELIQTKAPKFAQQLAALHGENNWAALLKGMSQLMLRLAENPLLKQQQYEALKMPVQIMVGDKDAMVSIHETLTASKHMPNATFAVLPNTKHPFDTVRTDLLLALMKDFWKT